MKAMLENVVCDAGLSIKAYNCTLRTLHTPYHFHPEAELVAVHTGHCRRVVGDHIANVVAGDLVFIGPNVPHSFNSEPSPEQPDDQFCIMGIQFLPELLGDILLKWPEGVFTRDLFTKSQRGVAFEGAKSAQIIEQMRVLTVATGIRRFVLLLDLLETLSRAPQPQLLASVGYSCELDKRHASRVASACDFIQKHFRDPIRRDDVAAHVCMSSPAFSRMFTKSTSLTFQDFLTQMRLSEAARQLLETDLSVADIAFRCGFQNLSNFNRRFLLSRKITPRHYRQLGISEEKHSWEWKV